MLLLLLFLKILKTKRIVEGQKSIGRVFGCAKDVFRVNGKNGGKVVAQSPDCKQTTRVAESKSH